MQVFQKVGAKNRLAKLRLKTKQQHDARLKFVVSEFNTSQIPIDGFNYLASACGGIFNGTTGREIKPVKKTCGYHYVTLCGRDKKMKQMAVHRIIAITFLGNKINQKLDVNHKNGNKTQNSKDNLEWATRSENQIHAAINRLKPCGEMSHLNTKLSEKSVLEILSLKNNLAQSKIAKIYGVSQTMVSKIISGNKWKYLTAIN